MRSPQIEIYDNGKTADQYTVIIDHHVYTMSRDADSPQGVCLYYGPDHQLNREYLGRKISFNDAPKGVKRQIREGYCFCVPNPDYPVVKPLTFI